jgi:hypothetical protein
MDRSFLSHSDVIAASRKFVCVRLMTYENQEEANFLKSLWVGRSGDLENTLFTILAPDGKRPLVRPARSPQRAFTDAEKMAEAMDRIAGEHEPRNVTERETSPLPLVANVKLALNVAACDGRPLLLLHAEDGASRKALEAKLATLAWSDAFIGRFVYVGSSSSKDLDVIQGAREGVSVVAPDVYGRNGKVLRQLESDLSATRLATELSDVLVRYERREKDFGEHVRQGRIDGVFWETVIPVTDPWEKKARERNQPQK